MMKLRNKKTGEIVDLSVGYIRDVHNGEFIQIKPVACLEDKGSYLYDTFAKFSEDWEDYKPLEPYIRNERIRKFVRDWAMFNQINTAHVERVNSEVAWFLFVGKDSKYCRWEMAVHADFFETFGENYENIERPINDFCGEEKE